MGDVSHLIQGSVNHPILLGDQLHGILELYGHLDEFPFMILLMATRNPANSPVEVGT